MGGEGLIWSVVSRLLQVPLLQELNERRLVVRMLADYWGTPVPINEDQHPTTHLFNIVEVCLRRPDGLNVLAEVVERIDGGSRHMAGVHRVVDSMAVRQFWPDDERDRLFAVLGGLPARDVPGLYRLAAGLDAPKLVSPATYQDALVLLETLAATMDGLPRAVVFVELLANTLPSGLAAELRQWSERQVRPMGLLEELRLARRRPPLIRNALTSSTKPPPHTPAYVIFLVQPEGIDGDRFRLSHWQQLDASQEWSPDRGMDHTGDLADIRHRIATLVEDVEESWGAHQPDIFVEFILPRELLNLDVDQWASDTDPIMPAPIGCRYPVAVRSLERMAKPSWHPALAQPMAGTPETVDRQWAHCRRIRLLVRRWRHRCRASDDRRYSTGTNNSGRAAAQRATTNRWCRRGVHRVPQWRACHGLAPARLPVGRIREHGEIRTPRR